MVSPAEHPPYPPLLAELYNAIGGLCVEFGKTTDDGKAFYKYASIPADGLPDLILERFPSDVDLSDTVVMGAFFREDLRSTKDGRLLRKYPLVANIFFQRDAPPIDPAGRGFRKVEWTAAYSVRGNNPAKFDCSTLVQGQRRYLPYITACNQEK